MDGAYDAQNVGVVDPHGLVDVDVEHGHRVPGAGVVEQHVERAAAGGDGLRCLRGGRRGRHVQREDGDVGERGELRRYLGHGARGREDVVAALG